jgi:hypothetical protein
VARELPRPLSLEDALKLTYLYAEKEQWSDQHVGVENGLGCTEGRPQQNRIVLPGSTNAHLLNDQGRLRLAG